MHDVMHEASSKHWGLFEEEEIGHRQETVTWRQSRDRGAVPTSPGTPRIADSSQKPGERPRANAPSAPRSTQPGPHPHLGLPAPGTGTECTLSVLSLSAYGNFLPQPQDASRRGKGHGLTTAGSASPSFRALLMFKPRLRCGPSPERALQSRPYQSLHSAVFLFPSPVTIHRWNEHAPFSFS